MIRLSGQNLLPLAATITGGKTPQPRLALYSDFLAADGSPIDHGLALHFPAPHSYTGEDVLELQAHGGPVVLQLLLARCLQHETDHLGGTDLGRLGQQLEAHAQGNCWCVHHPGQLSAANNAHRADSTHLPRLASHAMMTP